MSRKLFVIVNMIIMAVLAVIVARMLREPSAELAEEGARASGRFPIERDATPDQNNLPVTSLSETNTDEEEYPVAPLSSDRNAGQTPVTEAPSLLVESDPAPVHEAAPANEAAHNVAGDATDVPVNNATGESAALAQAPLSHSDAAPIIAPPLPELAELAETPAPIIPGPVDAVTPAGSAAEKTSPAPAPSVESTVQVKPDTANSKPVSAANATASPKPGTIVTKSSLPAKTGQNVVTQATMSMDGDVVILRLEANANIKGNSFILSGPDRAVLDLPGKWMVEAPRVHSNRMVKSLRVGNQENATRLVFDMRVKPNRVDLRQVSDNIVELRIR